ncbi:Minor outer membrane protein Omp16 [Thiorhodovibrio winogradskyi]|uniref:Minor outer membrane protein Omp16 n=1 Tax=Thiorhodovibrio winogradskyi TaxID=77007 RepID=A0ABZ0SC79_9GAMM|nr:OmpA family protein [Thiorhodovibrio winogradskyi]
MSQTHSFWQRTAMIGLMLGLLFSAPWSGSLALAEEYMKRGASVDDYQKALGRVLERKRGIVTARERQQRAATQQSAAQSSRPASSGTPSSGTQSSRAAAHSARPAGIDTGIYRPNPDQQGESTDGVSLYFGYDSAELTAAAQEELRKLGQALAAPEFTDVYWLIEGHTDASGAADYNQRLSEARAASARRFLIEAAGVAPDKLITVGKGMSELYDADRPRASVNRRVRLRPIGEDNKDTPSKAAPNSDETSSRHRGHEVVAETHGRLLEPNLISQQGDERG